MAVAVKRFNASLSHKLSYRLRSKKRGLKASVKAAMTFADAAGIKWRDVYFPKDLGNLRISASIIPDWRQSPFTIRLRVGIFYASYVNVMNTPDAKKPEHRKVKWKNIKTKTRYFDKWVAFVNKVFLWKLKKELQKRGLL